MAAAFVDNTRNNSLQHLGNVALERLMRSSANKYLHEVALTTLGAKQLLSVEDRTLNVWTPDLNETTIALSWDEKAPLLTITWEEEDTRQLLNIHKTHESVVLAE